MQPCVSVIIPVLNGETHIPKIMQYLDEQTFRDFETVIVADVKSTDSTLEVADSFSSDSVQVIVTDTEENISGSRNIGLENSSGELIWFLDVDDHPLPNYLERMVSIMDENNADVIGCNFIYVNDRDYDYNPSGYRFAVKVMDSSEAISDRIHERFPVTSWSKLFRRSLLEDNNIRFEPGFCEDILHTYKALKSSKTVCYTDEPLYLYYRHESSYCGSNNTSDCRAEAEQAAYMKLREIFKDNPPTEDFITGTALTRIRSSGHMSYRKFREYAMSEECRRMLKEDCQGKFVPEAIWYRYLPTSYYIAIRVFFRIYYYKDGRMFTRPHRR